MTSGSLIRSAALVAGLAAAALAQENLRYYQAVRANDLTALRSLVKAGGANARDDRGSTPLHYAAAYGSIEAMRFLLASGAAVDARNDFEATPLMWAATEPEKVRLLVERGADVNLKSKMGRTAVWLAAANDGSFGTVKYLLDHGAVLDGSELLAAASANDMATVRLLLEKGADVNVKDPNGSTPLIYAAANGNTRLIEVLLAKGAGVHAVTNAAIGGQVKHGAIAMGSLTPLLAAATYGSPEILKQLLDAGAGIDDRDVRGMTPLMLAVTSDSADPRSVRLLLDRGANPKIQDRYGLTAADWAKKMANPAILRELGIARLNSAAAAQVTIPVSLFGRRDPRPGAAKSIGLLQSTNGSFFKEGGCGACHAQNLTSIAVNAAWANRIPVNEQAKAAELKGAQLGWASFEQPLLQRGDPPVAEILTYTILQFASESAPPNRTTDAMIHNLMAQQRQAGNWHFGFVARPPMGDGDISRTATAIRALTVYAPLGRKAEAQRRVERAAAWLAAAPARTTEQIDMQLLGLKWAGAQRRVWEPGLRRLLAQQREDGGWGQTPSLETDAYATGQALYTLHELGVPPTDAAYKRGVQYLLQIQQADGSWHVKSRVAPIQPYFNTAFPYERDQWISNAATSWSAAALSYAAGSQQVARR